LLEFSSKLVYVQRWITILQNPKAKEEPCSRSFQCHPEVLLSVSSKVGKGLPHIHIDRVAAFHHQPAGPCLISTVFLFLTICHSLFLRMSYDPAPVEPRAVNPIEEGLFTLLAEELTIAEDKKEETKKGEEAVSKPSVDEQHALYSISRLVYCGQILLKR
jgi:hypothetical protein